MRPSHLIRQTVFKLLFVLQAPWLLRAMKGNAVTVLCFHRVSDEADYFFPPLPVAEFERLIRYCAAHYDVVSLAHATETVRTSKPRMVLSFDDGYYDFLQNALPILKKYGLPSNQNIVTACADAGIEIWTNRLNAICDGIRRSGEMREIAIGEAKFRLGGEGSSEYLRLLRVLLATAREERERILDRLSQSTNVPLNKQRMMTWDEIRQCHGAGVEIGSHTATHDALDTIAAQQVLEDELLGSRLRLEEQLQAPVRTVAYPNGRFSPSVLEKSVEAGYTNLLLTQEALFEPAKTSVEGGHRVPRISMMAEDYPQAVLRAEMFHSRYHYARRFLAGQTDVPAIPYTH